jgi:hypothetical protein
MFIYFQLYENAQESRPAQQSVHPMRLAIYLAQEMGQGLG